MFSSFEQFYQKAARRRLRRPYVRLGFDLLEDRLTPSGFSVSGTTLIATAGSASDTFALIANASAPPTASFDGHQYMGSMANIKTIDFIGSGGLNQASITDTTGFGNQLYLNGLGGSMTGANYTVNLTNMPKITVTGGVSSQAQLQGSAAHTNTFAAGAMTSILYNNVSTDKVVDFGQVTATAGTSNDVANFVGSSNAVNLFESSSTYSSMSVIGGYFTQADGFHKVTALSNNTGDQAELGGDHVQANTFAAGPNKASMTNSACDVDVSHFHTVEAVLFTQGDVANLYGSTTQTNTFQQNVVEEIDTLTFGTSKFTVSLVSGTVHVHGGTSSDKATLQTVTGQAYTFVGTPTDSTLTGNNETIEVQNFKEVDVLPADGTFAPNSNTATFYGSTTTKNTFLGEGTEAALSGAGFRIEVDGFAQVTAKGGTTSDMANLQAPLTLTGTTFNGKPGDSKMSWGSDFIDAQKFHTVNVTSADNLDVANLVGSATLKSLLTANANEATMGDSSYQINATGFSQVHAFAGTATDVASLSGSPTSTNQFIGTAEGVTLSGSWGGIEADGFHFVNVTAGTTKDTAIAYGNGGAKNTFTESLHTETAFMASSAGVTSLFNFTNVQAYAGTSMDRADLLGATGHTNTLTASPSDATLSTTSNSVEVHGFQTVTVTAGTKSDTANLTGDSDHKNVFTDSLQSLIGHLASNGNLITVYGFQTVNATAGTTSDTADISGSQTMDNEFAAGPDETTGLLDAGIWASNVHHVDLYVHTYGFANVTARGGTLFDTATLNGFNSEPNVFVGLGGDVPSVSMFGTNYHVSASGFYYIVAIAGTTQDMALLHGANPIVVENNVTIGTGGGNGDGTYEIDAAGFQPQNVHFF